ncbi:MAG: tRNA threonylcarbamoyladenosine biosynthesis protein TsaE [Gammaproteobacteria bacterium]|jgi:tRNA threonylcarbamoyladenosine biosynthesis protein TsaE
MTDSILIRDEVQMRQFGARLIAACHSGGVIALHGNLGTGKTTLVRGALQALGVSSGVRSPTYTLVEYYEFELLSIAHFDLYRLADGEELEYLGYRDYLTPDTLCLIEWPEKAEGYLSNIGLNLYLSYDENGRMLSIDASSDWGQAIVDRLKL